VPMPDVFTKAKRSDVMSRIRGRGNKETETCLDETIATRSHHRLAPPSVHIRKTGLYIPRGATGRVCGRLLLARLPQALQNTGWQSRVLEKETPPRTRRGTTGSTAFCVKMAGVSCGFGNTTLQSMGGVYSEDQLLQTRRAPPPRNPLPANRFTIFRKSRIRAVHEIPENPPVPDAGRYGIPPIQNL